MAKLLIESYSDGKKCSEYTANTPHDPEMIEWLRLQVIQGREIRIQEKRGKMKYPGFRSQNRQILFMNAQGKDICFERWRISLFYHPNYAATHFLQSEAEYNDFLKTHQIYCYPDYQEFRTDYEKEVSQDDRVKE